MNAGFLIPLALTVIYTLEMPQITVWHISLFLLFSAGATYRERWIFGKERTFFNMGIFFIPLMRKDFPTSDIDQVSLKTFIRGERISTTPGAVTENGFRRNRGFLSWIERMVPRRPLSWIQIKEIFTCGPWEKSWPHT
jgi:hypothetical protein